MNEKDLEKLLGAYNSISSLNVSGDVVDCIAFARANLREVMDHLSEEIKAKKEKAPDTKGKKTE